MFFLNSYLATWQILRKHAVKDPVLLSSQWEQKSGNFFFSFLCIFLYFWLAPPSLSFALGGPFAIWVSLLFVIFFFGHVGFLIMCSRSLVSLSSLLSS